ncbi:MAG: MnmC family methyltransferase [Nostocaceae cyanobacterium]|nr:MnmC family methyltransferase [Nostocaceae cyanobacterium]
MSHSENFVPQLTRDGSKTFFSQEFGESFHSHYGARQESFFKFVEPTQLALKANKPVLRLLDVCYGLGYNTAAALEKIWQVNPNCNVEIIGLELNLAVPQTAIVEHIFDKWNRDCREILTQLAFESQVQKEPLQAKLLIGDARKTIQQVCDSGFRADAIFLDPFSPPQCPHLWTVEFIKHLALCLHENGFLATYSCAAAVRTALLTSGLAIGSTPPVGRRSPGTIATHTPTVGEEESLAYFPPPYNLSQQEQEHLHTRAAIPYRDPQLQDTPDIIISRRKQEQKACELEPTSHWRKRWRSKIL